MAPAAIVVAAARLTGVAGLLQQRTLKSGAAERPDRKQPGIFRPGAPRILPFPMNAGRLPALPFRSLFGSVQFAVAMAGAER